MKYLLATDLHGSAYWAKQVVQKFAEHNADALILLGDVYNHGPRNPFPQEYAPMQVAQTLNALASKVVAIKGNCDSEVDQMISDFPFVQNQVLFVGGKKVFCTHGHLFNRQSLPPVAQGDVVVYGHFHTNQIVEEKGVVCVNVGSPSLPKDGTPAYCVLEENGIALWSFDGTILVERKF